MHYVHSYHRCMLWHDIGLFVVACRFWC